MTIGLAILIATILFLIDRNHVWPQAWRITKRASKISVRILVILLVGGLLTFGIYYAWGRIQDAHERREQEIAAKDAAQKVANADPFVILACSTGTTNCPLPPNAIITSADVLRATCSIWEKGHPIGSDVDWVGPKDNGEVLYPPQGCEGPLENAYQTKVTDTLAAELTRAATSAPKSRTTLTAKFGGDLTTQEYGSLVCAHVKAGDSVTLIEDSGLFVKVKTASGKTGWGSAANFEISR